MKLIDAEKFASDIRQIAQIHWGGLYWLGLDTIERILALEPAVEHYPGEERRMRWLNDNNRAKSQRFRCSECGGVVYYPQNHHRDTKRTIPYRFCPYCGSRVERKEE